MREHEQDVLDVLHRLAGAGTPVRALRPAPADEAAARRPPAIVGLIMPGWRLLLAGVAPAAEAPLAAVTRAHLRLVDAGRYGRFWWIELVGADRITGDRVTLLGSDLRLTRTGEGPGARPALAATPRFGHPAREGSRLT